MLDPERPAMDVPAALRNVLQQLQEEPQRYRLFGVWWWPIKALLKRAGYGPDQLYTLGSYQDPETAAMVPKANLTDTLRAAFEEYGQNARYPHADGMVENPDGELADLRRGRRPVAAKSEFRRDATLASCSSCSCRRPSSRRTQITITWGTSPAHREGRAGG